MQRIAILREQIRPFPFRSVLIRSRAVVTPIEADSPQNQLTN